MRYKVSYNAVMDSHTSPQTLLQQLLDASGLSQDKLADRLGVSFPTLNSWVNGKSTPRQSALDAIKSLAEEILGADDIDLARLQTIKATAMKQKYTIRRLMNNREALDSLTVDFTYHTNAMEGNTMTKSDVQAALLENKLLPSHTQAEQRAAINHQTALHFLLEELNLGENFCFTPELIQAVHLRLMTGVVEDAGHWRKSEVKPRGANFIKIPSLVANWCNMVNAETADPIGLLAASHAVFERIRPFADGNGRTGRLLLFALALRLGLVPPILPRARQAAYYKYLALATENDLTDPLEGFIAEGIIIAARKLERL